MDSLAFGKYFATLRKDAGYQTQAALGKIAGIESSTISRIESGDTKNPNVETLKKLAPFLNVSPEQIMEAAGYIQVPSLTDPTLSGLNPKELELIQRFRSLPPLAQQTVLNLISSLEEIHNTQKEQSSDREVG